MFSPDGRFLAYQSNESGRKEVYVQSFPDPGGKWQVSTAGGVDPRWRADGKEIYYRAPDQKLMAVEVQAGGDFPAGVPQPLFLGRFHAAHRPQPIRPVGRRAAFPLRRAARPRGDDADDGRIELVRGAGTVT